MFCVFKHLHCVIDAWRSSILYIFYIVPVPNCIYCSILLASSTPSLTPTSPTTSFLQLNNRHLLLHYIFVLEFVYIFDCSRTRAVSTGSTQLLLLLHYYSILGLHITGVNGLHGLAQQRRILQTNNLNQLRLLARSSLDHHLMHARRDGNRFQLIAIFHLRKRKIKDKTNQF